MLPKNLNVRIQHLRTKLGHTGKESRYILSERTLGYKFSISWSVYSNIVGTGKTRHDIGGPSFVRRYSSRVVYSVYFVPYLRQRD
jgi:DNA-binding winged helix-turn-helix (wHTH) protein